jgi:dynein intermediate chain
MSSAGESRRRAEIEAKRAKLAELKKAREERTSRLQAGRSDGKSISEATTPSSRKDLDDFVATLVGSGRGGSSSAGTRPGEFEGPATPSSPRRTSAGPATTSEFGGSEGGPSAVTTFVNRSDGEDQGVAATPSKLVDSQVQTEVIEAPKKVSVCKVNRVSWCSLTPLPPPLGTCILHERDTDDGTRFAR